MDPKENKSLDREYKIYKKIVNEFYSKKNILRWKKSKYLLPSMNSKKQKKQFRQILSKINKSIGERIWNPYDYNCEGKNMHVEKLIYLYENNEMNYKLLSKIYKNPLYNFIQETFEKNLDNQKEMLYFLPIGLPSGNLYESSKQNNVIEKNSEDVVSEENNEESNDNINHDMDYIIVDNKKK